MGSWGGGISEFFLDISPNGMTMRYRDNSESGHEITVTIAYVARMINKKRNWRLHV